MPPFLPQARPQVPANADLTNPLLRLGDTIGEGVSRYREGQQLRELGEAAQGGDLDALRDTAFRQGRIGVGLQASNTLEQRKNRAEDVSFRQSQAERSQTNADRAYALQEKRLAQQAEQFATQNETKLREIDAKNQKLSNVLTPGQKKTDETFAKEYVEFRATGGFADVEKQMGQLNEVAKRLETEGGLTGTMEGIAQSSEITGALLNPEGVAVREAVEEVVQRNLRLVLGAQFTQREGDRLISRAFNPNLGEEENAKRVRRLMRQIRTAAEQKQAASDYFEQNGTLVGFRGKLPSFNDFDPEGIGGDDAPMMQTPSGLNFRVVQ